MRNRLRSNRILVGVLVIAGVLVMIGLRQGQYDMVLTKAVRICLECVGIG